MGSQSTFTLLPREETILLYADFGTFEPPWAYWITPQRTGNILRDGTCYGTDSGGVIFSIHMIISFFMAGRFE